MNWGLNFNNASNRSGRQKQLAECSFARAGRKGLIKQCTLVEVFNGDTMTTKHESFHQSTSWLVPIVKSIYIDLYWNLYFI